MVKLTLKIMLLITPFILLFLIGEYYAREMDNSYEKKIRLMKKYSDINVLVLGNSHTYFGITQSTYSGIKCFNFANAAQTIYYDEKIIDKFLINFPHVRVVIIPVSYVTLEENALEDSQGSWRCFFYERYYGIPPQSNKHTYDSRKFSLFMLYGKNKVLDFIINQKDDSIQNLTDSGWYKMDGREKISNKSGIARVKMHESNMHIKNIDNNLRNLELIVSKLLARNTTPIIITTPVTRAYYNNINTNSWSRSKQNVTSLCHKYNIRYYHYFNDARFSNDDFVDPDHLNSYGADKFTKILFADISKYNNIIKLQDHRYNE
jgi:hypothetical protein